MGGGGCGLADGGSMNLYWSAGGSILVVIATYIALLSDPYRSAHRPI